MWKNSPGHDALMKESAYITAGVGFSCGGPLGYYWSITFAGTTQGCDGDFGAPVPELDVGTVSIGGSVVKAYNYTNTENKKVKVTGATWTYTSSQYDEGDFRVEEHSGDCQESKIEKGATCPLYITFAPKRSGKRSIRLTANLSNGSTFTIDVKGNASGNSNNPPPEPNPGPAPEPGPSPTPGDIDATAHLSIVNEKSEYRKGEKVVLDVQTRIDGNLEDGQFVWLQVTKPNKTVERKKVSKSKKDYHSTARFKQSFMKPGLYKFKAFVKSSRKKNAITYAESEEIEIEICKDKKGTWLCN